MVASLDRKCLGAKMPERSRRSDCRDIFDKEARRKPADEECGELWNLNGLFFACSSLSISDEMHFHRGQISEANANSYGVHYRTRSVRRASGLVLVGYSDNMS